jgi:quinol monooxygenase YgiN
LSNGVDKKPKICEKLQMSGIITVIAYIRVRAGKEPEAEQVLSGLIRPTQNEPGCISYDLFARPDSPGNYMFIETWKNREALTTHLQQPHVQAFISRSDELLAEPLDVSLWKHIPKS